MHRILAEKTLELVWEHETYKGSFQKSVARMYAITKNKDSAISAAKNEFIEQFLPPIDPERTEQDQDPAKVWLEKSAFSYVSTAHPHTPP